MNTSQPSDPGGMREHAGSSLATIQRIFKLLLDAIPFLNAIGDSFRALTNDPADDVASRAAIPAHVRSLLEEAVVEVGELEQQIQSLLRPDLARVSSSTLPAETPTIDETISESLRDAYSVLYTVSVAASKAMVADTSPEAFRLARSLRACVTNMGMLLRGAGLANL